MFRQCIVFTIFMLALLVAPANASCAKKNTEINQIIARLADLASSTDVSQQTRDKDAIRNLTSKMDDEDCINATPEMQRLHDLLIGVSVNLDAAADYGISADDEHDRYISLTPIPIKLYYSHDPSESVTCRCYARRDTVRSIVTELASLLDYASAKKITPREYTAMSAWYRVLDGYLNYALDIHVASLKEISGSDIKRIQKIADSALKRHCGITLYGTVDEPAYGECKYKAGSKTPAPIPSGSP